MSWDAYNYAGERGESDFDFGTRRGSRRQAMASHSKCILPGRKRSKSVARFLGVSPKDKIKTLR